MNRTIIKRMYDLYVQHNRTGKLTKCNGYADTHINICTFKKAFTPNKYTTLIVKEA